MSGFFGDKIKSECRIESECVESEERGAIDLEGERANCEIRVRSRPGFYTHPESASLLVR
jgi:hypothetical protein